MICELDAASLKDQLVNQQAASKIAETNYQNSKLAREVAELAVVEYADGLFKHEFLEVSGDIRIAEAELAMAEDELTAVVDIAKKMVVGANAAVNRAKLATFRAQFAVEKAQSRRKVLLDYTKGKRIKELKSETQKARNEELKQKLHWELQVLKDEKLERQIARCTVIAPTDGTLVYAPFIEVGATVRERQVLFNIEPTPETDLEKQ